MTGRGKSVAGTAAGLAGARSTGLALQLAGERWLWRLAAWRDEELDRRGLFPWLAVAFGTGIVLYFAAEGRPGPLAPLIAAALAGLVAFAVRRRFWLSVASIGLAALFCGFAAGVVRTATISAPTVQRVTIASLEGFVESVEEREQGPRIVVRVTRVGTMGDAERPKRVRLSLRVGAGALAAGDYILANARLMPPPQPARPGGFDFARDAYFKGIGAVGSVSGKVERRQPPVPADFDLRIAAAIDQARTLVTRRIADAIGGQPGALAAALVTGKRGLIDEETNDALRAAGLYHIVSISGLHMVLAAGLIFWLVRAGLCLSTTLASRWPVKKMAALAAMAGASAYCVFSGAEVATVRSLIMTLVMLGAILADRPALSMRNVAMAALIVLAWSPEALLGPSFQMSFGAVAALIAFAPVAQPVIRASEGAGPILRAWRGLLGATIGILGTTLVASVATGPFGAYHFQTANPFGLLGNALALPLVSIVVMPAAVVGMLAYPFGLDRSVWELMGFATAQVIGVSHWVESLTGSTLVVPAMPPEALILAALALLCLVLFNTPLRLTGLAILALAVVAGRSADRPDLYVDGQGLGAAVRGADGHLVMVGRAGAFTVEQWLRADGDPRATDDPALRAGARCDPLGCVVESRGGITIAHVQDARAFAEDCRRATIVITRLTAPAECRPSMLIDRSVLARKGAVTLTMKSGALRGARHEADSRPWMPRPEPPRPTASQARSQPPPRSAPAQSPAPPVPEESDGIHAGEEDQ